MAGRFFQFRLHPLDLKEIQNEINPQNLESELEKLLHVGGFPEPFLEGDITYYNRWKKSHQDIILRQDLIDLENVQQIISIETLIQLLKKRVGSPISHRSLSEDLQCSDKTVKRWLMLLENMYVIFKVPPFHQNIARAILKSPKYYFYDTGQVVGDAGLKLENLVACSLLKEMHFREDCLGENWGMYYLRNKDKQEIDFCLTREETPLLLLEVKWADADPSPNFKTFANYFKEIKKIQLVKELKREKTYPDGTEIRCAHKWLATLNILS